MHKYIHTCLLSLWHRQAVFESNGDKLFSSAKSRIRSWEVWDIKSRADSMPTHKPTELSRIEQKLELNSPSLWWVRIQPNWLHCRLAITPGSGDILVCCCRPFITIPGCWKICIKYIRTSSSFFVCENMPRRPFQTKIACYRHIDQGRILQIMKALHKIFGLKVVLTSQDIYKGWPLYRKLPLQMRGGHNDTLLRMISQLRPLELTWSNFNSSMDT